MFPRFGTPPVVYLRLQSIFCKRENWLRLGNWNKFHCTRLAQSLHCKGFFANARTGCASAIGTSSIALGLHSPCTQKLIVELKT